MEFTIGSFRALRFDGFIPVSQMSSSIKLVTNDPGIYVVLRTRTNNPTFLENSVGGKFKQRNPTVSIERLQHEWVDGAETLYI